MDYSAHREQILSKIEKGISFGFMEVKNGFNKWEFWIAVVVSIIIIVAIYLIYGWYGVHNDEMGENIDDSSLSNTPYWYGDDLQTTPDFWSHRDGYDYENDIQPIPLPEDRPKLPIFNGSLDTPKFQAPAEPKKKKCSKGEAIVRQTLEEHYRKPFPNIRPEFLRNPETNRKLELDCFNSELKLAAEYNGSQHYIWPNYTGQSYEQHIRQRRRDRYKLEVCDKIGIHLIIIPYTVKHNFIPNYVIQRLPQT